MATFQFSRRIVSFALRSAAVVAMLLVKADVAWANPITFTYGASDNNLSSITKTVDGVTLTLLNPGPDSPVFKLDSDGIGLGYAGTFLTQGNLFSFDLAVTGSAIRLIGYEVGWVHPLATAATFSMSGGSGSSTNNSLGSATTFVADGNWQLAPGQVGTLVSTGFLFDPHASSNGMSQILSLTVVAVPEPSTYAMALAGVACGGLSIWRRRLRRSGP